VPSSLDTLGASYTVGMVLPAICWIWQYDLIPLLGDSSGIPKQGTSKKRTLQPQNGWPCFVVSFVFFLFLFLFLLFVCLCLCLCSSRDCPEYRPIISALTEGVRGQSKDAIRKGGEERGGGGGRRERERYRSHGLCP
jgi:hypothetical protein